MKLAKIAEHLDYSSADFLKALDPHRRESLAQSDFVSALTASIKSDKYIFTQDEAEQLFKYITKSTFTTGLKASASQTGEKVQTA